VECPNTASFIGCSLSDHNSWSAAVSIQDGSFLRVLITFAVFVSGLQGRSQPITLSPEKHSPPPLLKKEKYGTKIKS